jgi:hypothetical protein
MATEGELKDLGDQIADVAEGVRDHTQGIPSLSERLQRTRDAIDFLGRKALKPEDYEQLKAIAGL